MEVQRKCQWCGKPFIAHTMVTRFCSKSCTEKAYKDKKRKQKLQEYEAKQNEQPMQEVGIVGGKPFLSPAEAATLFNFSKLTEIFPPLSQIFNLIIQLNRNKGNLFCVNFLH